MKQHKLESLIEALINTLTGMVIAYCTFQFILAPLLGIPVGYGQNAIITLSLTVVSVLRSYFWRRFFSNGLHKRVHCYLSKDCDMSDLDECDKLVEVHIDDLSDEQIDEFLNLLVKHDKTLKALEDD